LVSLVLAIYCSYMPLTEEKQAIFTFLNHYLALATLIGFIIVIVWVIKLVLLKAGMIEKYRGAFIKFSDYVLPLGFFITLFSTALSLYYSDYLGILPCGLCWLARVFIYPQVFLFGMAWYKNDKKILDYILALSLVGIIIALYHQSLQMGYSEFVPCPAIASTVDCAKPTFVEYGFITFPFMGVVTFCFSILLSLTYKFSKNK
jgi:disulfide bond formation protein DsbB